MSKEFVFFIYLLERYAEHLGVTADVAYRRLLEKNLVDYAIGMYEFYHIEAIENAFADLDEKLSAAEEGEGTVPLRGRGYHRVL